MRIGNLSRAGRPSGGHSGRLLRVLSLAGIGAMLLAGWQILPFALKSDLSGRAPTAALTAPEASGRALGHGEAKRPPAAPAPLRAAPAPEAPAPAAAPMPARTAAAAPESPAPAATAPRVVYSGPLVTSSAASGAAPGQPPAPEAARAPAAPVRSLAPAPAPTPPAPVPVAEPVPSAAPEPPPQRMAAAAPPAATGRVDLNAASVEELNAIPGAGLIGRAIVRGRPYASPEDLVTKRILNRAAYERIKDQITAQ